MSDGWTTKRLGSLGTVQTGTTPNTTQPENFGTFIPFVKPSNFAPDGSLTYGNEGLSEIGLDQARLVKTGSVLMVCIGATIGKVAYTTREIATNQQINSLTPDPGILPKFVYYSLSASDFQAKLRRASSQATLPIISKAKWANLEISIPGTLLEQQRIVAILDEAFAAITTAKASAEKNLQNARAVFESHLSSFFAEAAESGQAVPLMSVCEEITVGHVGSMAKEYESSGIPFLRSQNVRPFSISMENVVYISEAFHSNLQKSQLRPGDLAIVRTGYPGTAAVIPEELPISNCSDLVIIRPGPQLNSDYGALFFNSSFGREMVTGKLVGAAQKHFNITVAKQVPISLPALNIQASIVSRCHTLRAKTLRLESLYRRKLAALDELKKSLLHRAFNGDL